jgi:hypothetical protein
MYSRNPFALASYTWCEPVTGQYVLLDTNVVK